MIIINLVPEQLKKRSASDVLSFINLGISREIIFGVGGAFVALLIIFHVMLLVMQLSQAARLGSVKAVWNQLLPDRTRIDTIGVELREMKKKMDTIKDLTTAKAGQWSMKLNILSDALPKGVWLKRLVLDNGSLMLDGTAYSTLHNEIVIVGNVVAALKKDAAFSNDFSSIEVQSVQRAKRGPTEVADFVITAKLK